jgi:hypothetical protein
MVRGVDEAFDKGYFLRAGNLQTLAFLEDVNKVRSLEQGFMGAVIEPGVAAAESPGMEFTAFQISLVEIGDSSSRARGRLHVTTMSTACSS